MHYFLWINLTILLSILSFLLKKIRISNYLINTHILITVVLLLGFYVFRDIKLGSDFQGYVSHYDMLLNNEFSILAKEKEYLYIFLEKIFVFFNLPYEVFYGFLYTLMYIFIFKATNKYYFLSPLIVFSIFVGGFFFFSLSGVRQSLSIAIFFYSIIFIINKNIIQYMMMILLASLFHLSAIVLLPLYFINRIKYYYKLFLFIYIFTIIPQIKFYIYIFVEILMKRTIELIPLLSPYLNYLDTNKVLQNGDTSLGFGFVLMQVINFIILLRAKSILSVNHYFRVYYILFFISCIIYNLFYDIELITRINIYFNISFLIVFSLTIYYSCTKFQQIITLFLIFFSIILVQGRINALLNYL
jgi:hypothetical protein